LAVFPPLSGLLFLSPPLPASVPSPGARPPGVVAIPDPGDTVEAALTAGESHRYAVELAAGELLRAEVEQRGIDLAATVVGPGGEPLLEVDLYSGSGGSEPVCWVAGEGGRHHLRIGSTAGGAVTATDATGAGGGYRLRVVERRPAAEVDRLRCEADNLYIRAHALGRSVDPEDRRRAIELYRLSLPLFERLGDLPSLASALNNIGALHFRLEELGPALDHYRRALGVWQRLEDPRNEADTRYNLGVVHNALGQRREAMGELSEALDIYRRLGKTGDEAKVLRNLGQIHRDQGEIELAREHLEGAIERFEKVGSSRGAAYARLSLGQLHARVGRMQAALATTREALESFEELDELAGLNTAHNNLGLLYLRLGEPERALPHFEETLDLSGRLGRSRGEAAALIHLAALEELFGADDEGDEGASHLDRALGHYREAVVILEENGDRPMLATALQNLARCQLERDEPQTARDLLGRTLRLLRELGDRRGEAHALGVLAEVERRMESPAAAVEILERALPLARSVADRAGEARLLVLQARAERDRNRPEAALERVEEAIRTAESVRASVLSLDLRQSFLASRRDWYELRVELLAELHQLHPEGGYDRRAFRAAESARARGLVELLTEAEIEVERGISPELRRQERSLGERITLLQGRLIELHSAPGPATEATTAEIAETEAWLEAAERDLVRLEERIREEHPRYAELSYPEPLGATAVQELLGAETALLEYTLGDGGSVLSVLTREGLHTYRLPPAADVAERVGAIRDFLAERGPRSEVGDFGRHASDLYDLLLGPAREVLEAKTELLIVPDRDLFYLPFELLLRRRPTRPDFRHFDFLIRHHEVGYLPSATLWAGLDRQLAGAPSSPPTSFLGFGAPHFGTLGATGDPWPGEPRSRGLPGDRGVWPPPPLEHSAWEVKTIGGLFVPGGRARLLLDTAASEENAKDRHHLANADVLHFATHGLISERQPRTSGLVLTLDDDPAEDGILQAHEIFDLDLNAGMVVLSACSTGLGKELRGEGLVGLSRAFFYAGAPSVTVSLWRVDDLSTAELMIRFYKRLVGGEGRAEALRHAKLELLEETAWVNPYHWAPFVLIGEPGDRWPEALAPPPPSPPPPPTEAAEDEVRDRGGSG
jgi:CHAT domain-containing protein/tetratricopeptide (TPR) repeat protein